MALSHKSTYVLSEDANLRRQFTNTHLDFSESVVHL